MTLAVAWIVSSHLVTNTFAVVMSCVLAIGFAVWAGASMCAYEMGKELAEQMVRLDEFLEQLAAPGQGPPDGHDHRVDDREDPLSKPDIQKKHHDGQGDDDTG